MVSDLSKNLLKGQVWLSYFDGLGHPVYLTVPHSNDGGLRFWNSDRLHCDSDLRPLYTRYYPGSRRPFSSKRSRHEPHTGNKFPHHSHLPRLYLVMLSLVEPLKYPMNGVLQLEKLPCHRLLYRSKPLDLRLLYYFRRFDRLHVLYYNLNGLPMLWSYPYPPSSDSPPVSVSYRNRSRKIFSGSYYHDLLGLRSELLRPLSRDVVRNDLYFPFR